MPTVNDVVEIQNSTGKGSKKNLLSLISKIKMTNHQPYDKIWQVYLEEGKGEDGKWRSGYYLPKKVKFGRRILTVKVKMVRYGNYRWTTDEEEVKSLQEEGYKIDGVKLIDNTRDKNKRLNDYVLKKLSERTWIPLRNHMESHKRRIKKREKEEKQKIEKEKEAVIRKKKAEFRKKYSYGQERCRFKVAELVYYKCNNENCSYYKKRCIVNVNRENADFKNDLEKSVYWEYDQHCKCFKGYTDSEKKRFKENQQKLINSILGGKFKI